MKNFLKLFLGISFVFIIENAYCAEDSLLVGEFRIYDVHLQKEVGAKDLAAAMDQFDVMFIGEEHNDSVCHFFQKQMVELMYERFQKNMAISMEMFDRDVQDVMNEYLQGYVKEKVFIKDARAWNNYSNYKPMVEFAKTNRLDIICANAARRYTNIVGKEGIQALQKLSDMSKKNFAPLPYDTATGAYHKKLKDLTNHSGTSNDSTKPAAIPINMGSFNLILSQSLWDATMAYSIAEYLKKTPSKKVVMLNGRFHSEEGFGIVQRLNKYAPKANALVVTVFPEESYPNISWSKFKQLGDFIVITNPQIPKTYKE